MDDADDYFDEFARVYDARYADGVAGDDVQFYHDLAAEADGPALEVGVGTGRVCLELLAEGLDVDGVDPSTGMLDRLREKAADRGLDPSVWTGDARSLDVDREYGLVYVPARTFNHLTTLPDQRAALASIRDALAPDGRLALNTFVPDFRKVIEEYGEGQEDVVAVDGETYRVVTTARLDDPVEQVSALRLEVFRDGERLVDRETPLALLPKRQFELLFETTGFSSWSVQGGFDGGDLAVEDEMVWVVER